MLENTGKKTLDVEQRLVSYVAVLLCNLADKTLTGDGPKVAQPNLAEPLLQALLVNVLLAVLVR